MTEHEKREVARRIERRCYAEDVDLSGGTNRRAKDIAAEEMTRFYIEKQSGSIRWTTTREIISSRVRRRVATTLRAFADWLNR